MARSRIHAALFAFVSYMCATSGAWAHEHAKSSVAPTPTQTVSGELLDMNCYMSHEGKGEKHKQCAATCIEEGAPMGLLTGDGKVYLLVADHALKEAYEGLKGMAGEQVRVTGEVHERGGVRALLVKSAEPSKAAGSAK